MRLHVDQEMTYRGVKIWRGVDERGTHGCFVEFLPGFVGPYLEAERRIDDMLDLAPARRLSVA